MKALLIHCRDFRSAVKRIADRPLGISPEELSEKAIEARNAVVALLTIESGDTGVAAASVAREIRKMCRDVGHTTTVLFPFAHLSNDLADTRTALAVLGAIEEDLRDLRPLRVHYGSDKGLLIDVFGHKGNVRFRSF